MLILTRGPEIWAPIAGYLGIYEISSHGRVRSLPRTVLRSGRSMNKRGGLMTPQIDRRGYAVVKLKIQQRARTFFVHRLVASAFLPSVPGLDEVNHKDGVRGHNRVDNLEWCSRSQNLLHAHRLLRVGHSRLVTHEGRTLNISEWAEITGLKPGTLAKRIRSGMPTNKALSTC